MMKKITILLLAIFLIIGTVNASNDFNTDIQKTYTHTDLENGVTIHLSNIREYAPKGIDNHAIDVFLDTEMAGSVHEHGNHQGTYTLPSDLSSGKHSIWFVYVGNNYEYESEQAYTFTILEDREPTLNTNHTITNETLETSHNDGFNTYLIVDDEMETILGDNYAFIPTDLGIGEHKLQIVTRQDNSTYTFTQQYTYNINEDYQVIVDLGSYQEANDNRLTSAPIGD